MKNEITQTRKRKHECYALPYWGENEREDRSKLSKCKSEKENEK